MLKAIIVDDERYVCDLVRQLIDWEALGVSVIGVAYTGVEALEMLAAHRPDIVVSDIRMPGFDGLALVQRAQEKGLDTKFIMISGHKQFEYAQMGLQLGVVDYLLKPIKKDQLEAAVRRVIQLCRRDEDVIEMDRELRSNKNILRQQLVRDIQDGRLPPQSFVPARLRSEYALELVGEAWCFCFHLDCPPVVQRPAAEMLLDKMATWLLTRVGQEFTEAVVFCDKNDVLGLCTLAQNGFAVFRALHEACRMLLESADNSGLVVGVVPLEEAGNAMLGMQNAATAAEQRILGHAAPVVHYTPGMDRPCRFEDVLGEALYSEMELAVKAFSLDNIERTMKRCVDCLAQGEGVTVAAANAFFSWLIGEVNRSVGTLDEENRDYLDRAAVLDVLDRCGSLWQRGEVCFSILSAHLQALLEVIRKTRNRPVRLAKQLIETSYMDPIGLNEIADKVRLNPVYFSVLFKKETGKNFKEYLTEFRLAKAKELLCESEESVANIACMVGYRDTKYFSKLFAKEVGINPTQYRKLHV